MQGVRELLLAPFSTFFKWVCATVTSSHLDFHPHRAVFFEFFRQNYAATNRAKVVVFKGRTGVSVVSGMGCGFLLERVMAAHAPPFRTPVPFRHLACDRFASLWEQFLPGTYRCGLKSELPLAFGVPRY